MEWELFRTLAAVARSGSFTEAAKVLGVSQSTISRRLERLEGLAGSPLFFREAPLRPTPRGEELLGALGPLEDAALAMQSAVEHRGQPAGKVSLATVPELFRWVLAPRLQRFRQAHPELELVVITGNEAVSLAGGDADVALRLFRPERGELVAKRLAEERYVLAAAEGLELNEHTPWLGYAGDLAEVPEQAFAERLFRDRRASFRSNDVDSLGEALSLGLGVALVPESLVRRYGKLRVIPGAAIGVAEHRPPPRSLWLVVHRSRQRLPRVRALMDWLEACLSEGRRG